ncbi:hypothetical protein ES708_22551 [subsurface metagenome]
MVYSLKFFIAGSKQGTAGNNLGIKFFASGNNLPAFSPTHQGAWRLPLIDPEEGRLPS